MNNLRSDIKTCPKCGNEFSCSASSKCWCYEISLSSKVLEYIEDTFESCLCPNCLRSFEDHEKQPLLYK